jgi:tRNA-splicing ligase RtcB
MSKHLNVHQILTSRGYRSPAFNYQAIVKEASALQKQGLSTAEILSIIETRYGQPQSAHDLLKPHAPTAIPVVYFGEMGVDFEQEVVEQIDKAASIPVAVRAAVMPDGHPGYALPIGGVIALDNAVSPSFVGYDIACRMTLSILDLTPQELMQQRMLLAGAMQAVTSFGVGSGFKGSARRNHEVMEDPLWNQIPVLRSLRGLAHEQLGSSGGGNHFFDAMTGEVLAKADWMPLPVGAKFAAVMTHSGSRGPGNQLARYYVKLAAQETRRIARNIPPGYEWLPLDTQAGQEYWQVMQLMGRYAQASHHLIHDLFLRHAGLNQVARWENHHNFAFQEGGLVIHRKGATPAQLGRIGIIPGSSGTDSYLVEGLGNVESLQSSSHGAGRPRSRTASIKQYDARTFHEHQAKRDILSIGVAPDETFMAYKDIERIIALQNGLLVRVIARLSPVVVIMGARSDDGD